MVYTLTDHSGDMLNTYHNNIYNVILVLLAGLIAGYIQDVVA